MGRILLATVNSWAAARHTSQDSPSTASASGPPSYEQVMGPEPASMASMAGSSVKSGNEKVQTDGEALGEPARRASAGGWGGAGRDSGAGGFNYATTSSATASGFGTAASLRPNQRGVVYLHRGDRLGMHGFPPALMHEVEALVPALWPKGVSSVKTKFETTEIKMSGMPWHAVNTFMATNDIPARRLVLGLVALLSSRGYHLETSLVTSRLGRALDQETMYFRPGQPRLRRWCAVFAMETDKLCFLELEDQYQDGKRDAPKAAFERALTTWPLGVQSSKIDDTGTFRAKLRGTPWVVVDDPQVMHGRVLLARMMEEMEVAGYEMVFSAAVSMGPDAQDPGTMFFASVN